MDTLWILVPFGIPALIIFATYLIHILLRAKVNAIAANISTVAMIVLVVAAVLFPVFSKVREGGGPHSSCASNMKQLGLGFIQYVQDYDNKWSDMGSGGGYWASQIYSYEKSTGVYKCPDDSTQATTTPTYPISYAANSNLGVDSGGKSQADLTDPSRTVAAADLDNGTRTNFTTVSPGAPSNANGIGYYGNCNLGAPRAGPTIHDPEIMFLARIIHESRALPTRH